MDDDANWYDVFSEDCVFHRGLFEDWFIDEGEILRISSAAFKSRTVNPSVDNGNMKKAEETLDWGLSINKDWKGIGSLSLRHIHEINNENGCNISIVEKPISGTLFPNLAHCELYGINSKKIPKKIAEKCAIAIDNRS